MFALILSFLSSAVIEKLPEYLFSKVFPAIEIFVVSEEGLDDFANTLNILDSGKFG